MVNEWFGHVRGVDGLLHVVSKAGYAICGMGRQTDNAAPGHVTITEQGTPNCFQCYLRPWPRWFPEGFFDALA